MVRSLWLVVTFVAGVLLGLLIARREPVEPPSRATTSPLPAAVPAQQDPAPAAAAARPPEAAQVTRKDSGSADFAVPAADAAVPAVRDEMSVEYLQGDEVPTMRDSLSLMHEAFMNEVRDDSWAYMREAEIGNTLIADTGAGNFHQDRLECRATMCEVWLSARGESQDRALRRWYEQADTRPRNPELYMRMASLSGDGEQTTLKLVMSKPPPGLPLPGLPRD